MCTQSISFLLDKAGPIIKYRTLQELCNNPSQENINQAYQNLLSFPLVQNRLNKLKTQDIHNIHGAKSNCFENSIAMLLDCGLNIKTFSLSSLVNIDEIISYYESLVLENRKNIHYCTTMYPFFLRAGYRNRELLNYMIDRVDTIYSFTKYFDFDIYDSIDKHKGMPKNYRDRPVIKPELYQDYSFKLPLIYDIVGFIELYNFADDQIRTKISSIIDYIFTVEYHRFTPFYGIVKHKKGYAAMGWDCMLPGFEGNSLISNSLFLQRMEMFSNFDHAVDTVWFQNGLKILESYKTNNNTYLLPKDYFVEQDRCWLLGNHTKLGEGNDELSRELESTFWVLKIKNNAKINKNQ